MRSSQVLPGLFEGLPVQADLRREIDAAVDESGTVRDTAAPALGELRLAMRELANSVRKELGTPPPLPRPPLTPTPLPPPPYHAPDTPLPRP